MIRWAPWKRWAQRATAPTTARFVDKLRNVAIIAHGSSNIRSVDSFIGWDLVDHGKTTLVDGLLRSSDDSLAAMQTGTRVMDSNELERERGITILSKAASVAYRQHRINIVDTPGHADFGGEVERILSMVDGVVLVVDGTEGPMTQTRFVLAKALAQQLRPLVVINKVDRPTVRLEEVQNDILDLFLSLNASDDQLDYPLLFASAKEGWATRSIQDTRRDQGMAPILDAILKHVPSPRVRPDDAFSMLITQLESDPFVGKCLVGRIQSGRCHIGDRVKVLTAEGQPPSEGRILKLFHRRGLERTSIEEALAGDIISMAGVSHASVNHTIASPDYTQGPIPAVQIDPPTVSMTFSVNDSPLKGKDGSKLTSTMIRDRLRKETETNISLQLVESASSEVVELRGRGELQIGILIENMRREGFELTVSPPRVVFRRDPADKKIILEPIEEVVVDVPIQFSGSIIQKLNKRKGEMKNYTESNVHARVTFEIPSRGLLGFVADFKYETSGQGVINHIFLGYTPFKGEVDKSRKGSLISTASGVVTAHALQSLEPRGVLFVKPGDEVYPGMVVGEHNKDMDLDVNPVKAKKLTNVRSATKDDNIKLTPPRQLSLEQVLSYIQDDEVIEVTPSHVRISKRERDPSRRNSKSRQNLDWVFDDAK